MNRTNKQRGFTLVELLVVLAILALLAGLVGPQVLKQLDNSKPKAAKVQIEDFGQAVELFKLDVGRFPSTAEGLAALIQRPASAPGWNGPYLRKQVIPADPWQHPYLYQSPGRNGAVDIWSQGADGAPGGEGDNADIGNWH